LQLTYSLQGANFAADGVIKYHLRPCLVDLWSISVKKWQCIVCGLIYDEAEGWPDDGIEPGTVWEDVPEDWMCPECGVGKEDFEMVEID
tara:strand:- start:5282 stop:5548 length:267 start_codon:yes stop_codon:yes gene_type:complete